MAKKQLHAVPRQNKHDMRVPLSGGFMITSMFGFIISVTFTFSGRFNEWFSWSGENGGYTWGFAFMLLFVMMFIASVTSITPRADDL